jgi:hypothetical protein
MGKNKKLRKSIRGLERRIHQHEEKIAREKERFKPDPGLISHWESEVKGWHEQIERKLNRLPGRK